ncbi:MAG: Rrf2 family transcriptional regulator [Pelovirga sp.]
MVITRATEYAIRTIIYLAQQPRDKVVLKKDICRTQEVTPAFLTKILQPLIKSGIVSSQRGVGGGFMLARDPEQITLLDVFKAQEGELKLNHCLIDSEFCARDAFCAAHEIWEEAQQALSSVLLRYSIGDIVRRQEEKLKTLNQHGTQSTNN